MEIGKTLLSDGSVVSDDGTILVPASEIGRIMFKNTAPRIGKVMKPDGSIVEDNGKDELLPASEIGREMFENTTPRIGKVMNPDGSIVEATGTGGGVPGPPSPPGPPGPGVFIRVFLETEHEYILEVINEGGDSFLTPNLKGSAHIGFY